MQPQGGNNFWQPQGEQSPEPVQNPSVPVSSPQIPVTPPLQPAQIQPQPASTPPLQTAPYISWQASEYVHHEKQALWFVALFGGAAVLLLVSLLLVQSITFAILIVVMAVVAAVFAVRPPRIMSYELSDDALQINGKPFLYQDFRNFGIIQEGPLYSALLIPRKRFMPMVTLYFPADNGEVIVDMLGSHLPMEHVELDAMDKLTRKLRF